MRHAERFTGLAWRGALAALLILALAIPSLARPDKPWYQDEPSGPVEIHRSSAQWVDVTARVHDVGQLWLTMTNNGFFGNHGDGDADAVIDPCTGEWAPQCEYPGGSGAQYIYRGATWIGAMIQEEGFEYPRVSHGSDGWQAIRGSDEFWPVEPVVERTTRSNAYNCLGDFITSDEAVSEQDFITAYADTFRQYKNITIRHGEDGPHVPLGLKLTQRSYAWSYNYAQDFIIVDFEIENIADKFLKNLYVGLFVDADVGRPEFGNFHTDDICGFTRTFDYLPPGATEPEELTINAAWIADNDGRRTTAATGPPVDCPSVTGSRVVRAPNPRLRTSFNWWISNSDVDLDFGPAWVDDNSPGDWTARLGTPVKDEHKYFVLSNREFDYDQYWTDEEGYIDTLQQRFVDRFTGEVLESHSWREVDASNPTDLANGYDTRYLISWGPLGIFDYIDEAGNRVYRLNPGEKFSMTFAYVGGENFHDRNNPQPNDTDIDPELFNYNDFQYNADWAAKVYDNPMVDTPDPRYQPDAFGNYPDEAFDFWYGEDVGTDQIYRETPGEITGFIDYENDGNPFTATYVRPDEDGSELNGRLEPEEDLAPRPAFVDWTWNNQLFDQGDGIPDFKGPPPPPAPVVTHRSYGDTLVLQWTNFPSQDPEYRDPFSRIQDFEGYRVYVGNSGAENEYSFLATIDRVDWAYYTAVGDSLVSEVYYDSLEAVGDRPRWQREVGDLEIELKAVGQNLGLESLAVDTVTAEIIEGGDTTYVDTIYYEYVVENAHPMMPRYYSVTAFDYGDYKSGTEPLETAKSASQIYQAPDRTVTDRDVPGVVPNPYRANQDYTKQYLQLTFNGEDTTAVSWENRNDGTVSYFPQTDRRIYFYNLPRQAMVRIFTVAGDLVQMIRHDADAPATQSQWQSEHAVGWDLNSRNKQQVVSGLYLFSVEDLTDENNGDIHVGKFVIIR